MVSKSFAETSQYVCECGDKHDEFDLGVLRVQYCPVTNTLETLEETPTECELEHDVQCTKQHVTDHKHELATDLSCKKNAIVTACNFTYTGGRWISHNADA